MFANRWSVLQMTSLPMTRTLTNTSEEERRVGGDHAYSSSLLNSRATLGNGSTALSLSSTVISGFQICCKGVVLMLLIATIAGPFCTRTDATMYECQSFGTCVGVYVHFSIRAMAALVIIAASVAFGLGHNLVLAPYSLDTTTSDKFSDSNGNAPSISSTAMQSVRPSTAAQSVRPSAELQTLQQQLPELRSSQLPPRDQHSRALSQIQSIPQSDAQTPGGSQTASGHEESPQVQSDTQDKSQSGQDVSTQGR
jgi:hypothetical protein